MEEWAGEVRVNLLRLAAVASFYANHLLNYTILAPGEIPETFHVTATGIVGAWALAALLLHVCLRRQWNPPLLKYGALAADLLMITLLLSVGDGPRSPMVVFYFLVVAAASLRLDLKFVWASALGAILALSVLFGLARWGGEDLHARLAIPRRHQLLYVLGLGATGLIAGQAVRQARRLGLDVARRMEPGA